MILSRGEIEFNRHSVESSLPHTCVVMRRAQVGQTPYEEPVYGDWEPNGARVPCRFWAEGRRGNSGEQSQAERLVITYEYRLKVPVDTDITEADTVDDVWDEFAEPMHSVPMRITAIFRRATETVCVLEKVR